jgi:hypothetical protein
MPPTVDVVIRRHKETVQQVMCGRVDATGHPCGTELGRLEWHDGMGRWELHGGPGHGWRYRSSDGLFVPARWPKDVAKVPPRQGSVVICPNCQFRNSVTAGVER